MKKITLLLIFMLSLSGHAQFPQTFESIGTAFPTAGWDKYEDGAKGQKVWVINSANPCEGLSSAFIDRDATVAVGSTSEDYLVSPVFTVPTNGQIRFSSIQGFAGEQGTGFKVKILDASLGAKSLLAAYETVGDWTEVEMNAVATICEDHVVNLPAKFEGKEVYLAFVRECTVTADNKGGDRWWIDNVNVVSRCFEPSGLSITNLSATKVTLNWVDTKSSKWDVELVPAGSTFTGNPSFTATTNPYNLTGLTENSDYCFYVRSHCDKSNSDWVGPVCFKTVPFGTQCDGPIDIATLPYQSSGNTGDFTGTFNGQQSTAASCGATPANINYFEGNDVFYSYTATKDGLITIKMTPTANNSSLFVYGTCPTTGPCLAGAANNGANVREIPNFAVKAGTTYIIAISSAKANPKIGYTLIVQEEHCVPPVGNIPSVASIGTDYVDLSWSNPSGATSWRVAVQKLGSPVPTAADIIDTADSNPWKKTGLKPGTQYQYYVQAKCADGSYSVWAGPYAFNTLICNDTDKCTYNFVLTDTFANGWNGASMQVRQNGIVVATLGSTFVSGAGPISIPVKLCPEVPFDIFWDTAGSKPAECVVTVKNKFDQVLFVKTAGITAAAGAPGTPIYDNIAHCDKAQCDIAPNTLSSTNLTTNGATLQWNAPATTKWEVYIVESGSPAPTSQTPPTLSNVTSNPLDVSGWLADTCYDFYVRVMCSPEPSAWSAAGKFCTKPTCVKPKGLFVPATEITETTANLYWNGKNWKGPWVSGTSYLVNDAVSYMGASYFCISKTSDTIDPITDTTHWALLTDPSVEILVIKAIGPYYGIPAMPTKDYVTKPGDLKVQIDSPVTSPYNITGLEQSTIYYYYIRTLCAGNDKSVWAGPVRFETTTCNDADKCEYTFRMTDSGNNGWDGARMDVRQNGIKVGTIGSSISNGGPEDYTVNLCPGIPFDVYWNVAGTKPLEVGLQIINPFGDPIFTKLPGTDNSLSVITPPTLKGNCTPPSCPKPTVPMILGVTQSTVTLGWTAPAVPGATQWEVFVIPTGTGQPVDGSAVVTANVYNTNPFTVTGLNSSITYDFYMRAVCSDGVSAWTILNPKTFTTTPVNDNCANAITVPVNDGKDCVDMKTGNTTRGATTSIPGDTVCQGFADDDVWFSFVAKAPTHIISLKNIVGTTSDLNHTVYSGNDCAIMSMMYCSAPDISVATGLTVGNIYKIRVYTNDNGASKFATFDVCITTPPPVLNDECSSAIELPLNIDLACGVSTPGTVTGATATNVPSTCVGKADDDVWYKFVATSTTHYVTFKNVLGTSADLNHSVYEGTCDGLVLRTCSTANSLQSQSNTYIIGKTYYVRVWSNSAAPQAIDFNICIGTVPPPITVSTSKYTKKQLVEDILIGSPCAKVTNVTWSTGTDFSSVNGIGYFNKGASAFPFKDGIVLSSGNALSVPGPNTKDALSEGSVNWPGDAQLETVVLKGTGVSMVSRNASKLEFDFVALSEHMSFNFLLASEEYGTYQCNYADSFAFLLTNKVTKLTTNLAVIPGTQTPVSVITIRDKKYNSGCSSEHQLLFDKYYGAGGVDPIMAPVNYNGTTVPLVAKVDDLQPGTQYHIKLVIADRGDTAMDTSVFIEGGSFNIGNVDLGEDLLKATNTALCFGDHLIKSGLAANQYTITWSKDGQVIPNQTTPDLLISEPGTYMIQAHYNNSTSIAACDVSDSVVIEYYDDKKVGTPLDMAVCTSGGVSTFDLTQNSPLILNPFAGNHEVTYYKSYNEALSSSNTIATPEAFQNTVSPQTIYARVDNTSTNCYQIVSFNLTVQDLSPKFTLDGNKKLCYSEPTTISVVPTNNSFDVNTVQYSWTFNGNTIGNATGSSLSLTGIGAVGSYTVTVNNNGCTTTQTFEITPSDAVWDVTFANAPYAVCPGQSVSLSFTANNFDINNPDAVYTWTAPDGTTTVGKTLSTSTVGDYTLEVDIFGCKNSKTVAVVENNKQIGINIESGCSLNDFQLIANPVGGSFDPVTSTIEWTATNGGSFVATDKKNTIILHSIGTYKVKVTTADGCSSEEMITVIDISCTIQKGISPGSSTKNDSFDLSSLNVKRLEVFNRYGTEVYSLDNYTNEWHGQTNDGSDLPDGTYFYQIHFIDNKVTTGWVYINRKR